MKPTQLQSGKKRGLKTIEYVRKKISDEGDTLISDVYIDGKSKLKIKCHKCNNIYEMTFNNYQSGYRCKQCGIKSMGDKKRYNQQDIENYIKEAGDLLVSKYQNTYSSIKILCGDCQSEFITNRDTYMRTGTRCECKSKMKGYAIIRNYLTKHKIEFEEQKTFDNCKNKLPLPFDFYLSKKNILIEYDGNMHFEPCEYFGGKRVYDAHLVNNNIKNSFCLKNGINLFRISHTDFKNIEPMLIDYLETKQQSIITYSSPELYEDMIDRLEKYMTENIDNTN